MVGDYWFYMPQSIYVAIKDNVMLYDTIENRQLIISESFMKPIFMDLQDIGNMGVVRLERSLAESDAVRRITDLGMGVLLDIQQHPERPVLLPSQQTVNLDYDRIKDEKLSTFFLNKDLSRYLLDLSIVHKVMPNSRCSGYFISGTARQTNQKITGIPVSILQSLMDQIQYYPLTRVRIISDSMDRHDIAGIKDAISRVMQIGKKPVVCVNVDSGINDMISAMDDIGLQLVVDSFSDPERLRKKLRCGCAENSHIKFVIRNEREYTLALDLIMEFGIEDYEVYPFIDGANRGFISYVMSPEREEIFARPISMKEIFRNSKLNSNTFGRMTVVPNGDIHADSFSSPLGNIRKDRMLDCIQKAVSSKDTWRFTRQYPRCAKCLFQYLCPPPSAFDEMLDFSSTCTSFMK